ncbi:hypothetical protein GCM10009764_10520 [Nocardia ninae]|uniref:Uncharacterized protein n=1 Tax=Nocardia ninae NBRC 108245 TaxID=1210091 RepID=A0A511MMR0_9NOCA|nr:hypothetical protein NN4_59870 [Nocardia ninae NBRC 108245]
MNAQDVPRHGSTIDEFVRRSGSPATPSGRPALMNSLRFLLYSNAIRGGYVSGRRIYGQTDRALRTPAAAPNSGCDMADPRIRAPQQVCRCGGGDMNWQTVWIHTHPTHKTRD